MEDRQQASDMYNDGDRTFFVLDSPGPPEVPFWLKLMALGKSCEQVLQLDHSEEIHVFEDAEENVLAIQMPKVIENGGPREATIDGLRLILDEDGIHDLVEVVVAAGKGLAEIEASGADEVTMSFPLDFC
mgnify:CR=1 FL=1